MKLQNLLLEEQFKMFKTFFYFEFDDSNMDVSTLANIVRAVDLVAVVNNKSDKEDPRPRALFQIKIATTTPPRESFEQVKNECMTKISEVKKCQFSERHIEEVNL
jgi:hypothetical protein